jgi:hypothetical protein
MQELFTVERIEDGETLSDPFDYDYSFFTDRETAEEFSGDSAHETHKPCKVVRFIRETPEIALRLNAHEGLVEALKDAVPYIAGSYECAFPDEPENERVLQQAKAALAMLEGK